jgi:hypothetical protein
LKIAASNPSKTYKNEVDRENKTTKTKDTKNNNKG